MGMSCDTSARLTSSSICSIVSRCGATSWTPLPWIIGRRTDESECTVQWAMHITTAKYCCLQDTKYIDHGNHMNWSSTSRFIPPTPRMREITVILPVAQADLVSKRRRCCAWPSTQKRRKEANVQHVSMLCTYSTTMRIYLTQPPHAAAARSPNKQRSVCGCNPGPANPPARTPATPPKKGIVCPDRLPRKLVGRDVCQPSADKPNLHGGGETEQNAKKETRGNAGRQEDSDGTVLHFVQY